MVLIANDKPTEVLEPGEQTFDLPAALVPPQRSAVLGGWFTSIAPMRSDHLHTPFVFQPTVQFVAVVRLIPDHALGQVIEEAGVQCGVNERYLVRAGATCANGERKTLSVCKAHDFGAFAAFGLAHTRAPFFAWANVPSMNPSLRSMPPRSRKSSAKAARIFSKVPARVHSWNRRWHVAGGGYRSGRAAHGAPVRSTHRMPSSTSRGSRGGRPGLPGRALGLGMKSAIRCQCSFVKSVP